MRNSLSYFSRKTTSGRFIPEIDGLRFICIAWVVLFHIETYLFKKSTIDYPNRHTENWLGWFYNQGHWGVAMFFIISGFVLGLPFASHFLYGTNRPKLKDYFTRRLTRLEPPFIISMTLLLFYWILFRGYTLGQLIPHYFGGITYLHNIIYGQANLINGVAWSLEIEVQFYILAPFLATVFALQNKRLRRSVLLAIILVSILLNVLGLFQHWPVTVASYFHYFLIGFLFVDYYLVDWQRARSQSLKWDMLFVVSWVVLIFLLYVRPLGYQFVIPFSFLLMFSAVFKGQIANKIFTNTFIYTIGGMCYSIYLLHYWIIVLLGKLTIQFHFTQSYTINLLFQASFLVPFIIILCAAFFALFERPFMDKYWPRKLRDPLVRNRYIRSIRRVDAKPT